MNPCFSIHLTKGARSADAYLKQNVFTKQKLAADFVVSIPYDAKSQNKTCCTFCEAGLPKPFSQSVQHVLLHSGFEQNVHKVMQNVIRCLLQLCN
jgi:hypothetical protein